MKYIFILSLLISSCTTFGQIRIKIAGGGTSGISGNTKYVVGTSGVKVDSLANVYTVKADTILVATNTKVLRSINDSMQTLNLAGNIEFDNATKTASVSKELIFNVGDETTVITAGTDKYTLHAPYGITITGVKLSLTTASTSGIPTIDINENGLSILSTKLTADATEETSVTAAILAVISDVTIANNARITVDVDVAGTGAKGIKVTIYYTRN